MMGGTSTDNNVFVFFEGHEIGLLRKDPVSGLYLFAGMSADMAARMSEVAGKTPVEVVYNRVRGSVSSVDVFLRGSSYERLAGNGMAGVHEGVKNIYLLDSKRLGFKHSHLYEHLQGVRRKLRAVRRN